ncbi:MAG TPA: adenine phosphoribosyltransferase [bacterium]|nr:adenine phosphoribosyltransferase [bacterium]HPN43354.1 adenine phosphoribosyltransferase [bacterium]
MDLKKIIRQVPDFPKKGINFIDITTLINDGPALREAVKQMKDHYRDTAIDVIVGIESRGFIFGAILAHELGLGFVPVRKPGKLPAATIRESFALEYGQDAIEIHLDALKKGQRVLIVDDLLATGGTVQAAAHLVERLDAIVVGCCFLVELDFLGARKKLAGYRIESLVHYSEE